MFRHILVKKNDKFCQLTFTYKQEATVSRWVGLFSGGKSCYFTNWHVESEKNYTRKLWAL